ncbi:MAG: helical backbone metal receptor [Actinomycetota bacterium]|nr:helical backbone metal receptor [Actinomycetota bacterium]
MHRPTPRIWSATFVVTLLAVTTLVSCGGADSSVAMSGTPTVQDADQAPVRPVDAPTRIVSMSPSITEMLFAIGAGDQIVAVDSYSYFPEGAPVTDLSGLEPNIEAILGYDPDLVLISYDPGDVIAGLETAGVAALALPAAAIVADTYAQIEKLGEVTGNGVVAAQVVAEMRAEMDLLATRAEAAGAHGLSYYHELDDTLFSATSSTFIGEIYAMAGLVNVADAADSDGSAYGYPQLSAEFLVDAGPDLIFLADVECCAQTADVVSARPGWETIPAVVNGNIIELPADVHSRWGPRIVDFLQVVVTAVSAD